jgi:hypothetical protein
MPTPRIPPAAPFAALALAAAALASPVAAQSAPTFETQARLGLPNGDQWEPAIAADQGGHVYLFYMQFDCPSCLPTAVLQTSDDYGTHWNPPAPIPFPAVGGQYDTQIAVDPVDGQTVYASWLNNKKSQVVVAKSTDYGLHWTSVVASQFTTSADKDILAVHGNTVCVADGGQTFSNVAVKTPGFGVALAGGGATDGAGGIWFSWAGYANGGQGKGPVTLFVTRSADFGKTWAVTTLGTSGSPPDCSSYQCGWAFLGAQAALARDEGGTLYAFWCAGDAPGGPERPRFAFSKNGGATWSAPVDVSLALPGVDHCFPAVVAGLAGDVRVGWMDARASFPSGAPAWNVYFRQSADGGANWSDEAKLSSDFPGYTYIGPAGFAFPFGDYFWMAIDGRGATHAAFGEGANYATPGTVWYTDDVAR